MKKRKYIAVVYFMICCLLTGCMNQNPASPDQAVSEGGSGASVPETTLQENASSALREKSQVTELPPVSRRVCFLGNSLIEYGGQADFLEDIAWGFGQNITVDQITWGGAYLRDYARGLLLDKEELKDRLGQADIVVFQDYGGWQGKQTVQSIRKLEKWCNPEAALYYYMYEDDHLEMTSSDYRKLKKLNLSFIPKGQMIECMYGFDYSYEDLHVEGDFHPNSFNGYLSALMMYAVLFQEECSSLPREWFPADRPEAPRNYIDLDQSFHGDTAEEKWEEFQKICQKMDELIENPENPAGPDEVTEIKGSQNLRQRIDRLIK